MKTFGALLPFALIALLCACSQPDNTAANPAASGDERADPGSGTDVLEVRDKATSADPATAETIGNYLRTDYLADQLEYIADDQRRFVYDAEDLNGDGDPEYLVGFHNPYFCGSGGCSYYLMKSTGESIASFTVSRAPFIVLDTAHNGWPDLAVYSNGSLRLLEFDGSAYPPNPSVAPEFEQTPDDSLRRLLETDNPAPSFRF